MGQETLALPDATAAPARRGETGCDFHRIDSRFGEVGFFFARLR
jgi:hypothetical protein